MLVLPWYVRFGIDCALVATPFYLLSRYPRVFGQPWVQGRRIKRRKTFEQAKVMLTDTPTFTVEETQQIYKNLGMEV